MTKILAAFGVFAVAAVMFFAGIPPFPPRGGEKEGDPVEEARIADVAPVLPLAGEVVPAFQVDVKPEIGGKIREIHVVEGQAVRKGDLLITIDDTDLLSERAGVEAEIEGARLAVEKTGSRSALLSPGFWRHFEQIKIKRWTRSNFLLEAGVLRKKRRRRWRYYGSFFVVFFFATFFLATFFLAVFFLAAIFNFLR
jgi:hypothetical protein